MLFRELKQGYPLYFLNRNTVEIQSGSVTNVSQPHVTTDPAKLRSGQLSTVVDATVVIGGKQQVIELPDSMAYTTSSDSSLLISPNKEDILNGVRFLKANSEEALKLVGQHKEVIKRCDALLQDFDPAYKQIATNDERFAKVEASISAQNADIQEIKDLLKSLMK